jgi:NADH-quinone oxidoreductase subunit N
LGLVFLAALLSLGGIPPFAGFFGKLLVFGSAIQAQMVWLAVVGVLNSIVALYYYLTVLKVVWGGAPEGEYPPLAVPAGWVAALAVCMVGILVLGVIFSPFYAASANAASALILH